MIKLKKGERGGVGGTTVRQLRRETEQFDHVLSVKRVSTDEHEES
jgi:hypothetical protein